MDIQEKGWRDQLQEEFLLPYMKELAAFLEKERNSGILIYPEKGFVFSAFEYTPFDQVKVVIIGQDPYHGKGQAHGLSFSVSEGISLPPSLKNIFRELVDDMGICFPKNGCLIPWAKQGVFLLNSILTVEAGKPKSHHKKGWEQFTNIVVEKLLQKKDPIVFLLWGKLAEEKAHKVFSTHHKVLIASHPSPYSVKGFLGCRHFSQVNDCLTKWGKDPIYWDLS